MYICLYPEILYIIYDHFLLIVIVSVSYPCVFCISVFASFSDHS
ncbi:putative membrane protein [Escherichia coli 2-156-04_S4_C2]|nr:putative membrane protein [Escherichia coli 2-156-04_S4_C2]